MQLSNSSSGVTQKIMIVAGEASGDLHGSNLVKQLQALKPSVEFIGMGGPELKSCGVEILFDAAKIAVMGISEVIGKLATIYRAQKILQKALEVNRPDLLLVIDLPDFNLRLAKHAKKLGIPVYYYIVPKVWAWRSSRVHTIGDRADGIGVILPFEKEFFAKYNIAVQYVGNPLLDSVQTNSSKQEFRERLNINPSALCVGLLPGSRKREISSLLPVCIETAEKLHQRTDHKFHFLVPKASTIGMEDLENSGLSPHTTPINFSIVTENRYDMMAACDGAIAASGTITLELAILEIPMVVVYKVAPVSYHIGKALVKLDHFSLVNLISGTDTVPELLQDEVNSTALVEELLPLLTEPKEIEKVREGLADVKNKLGKPGASKRVAEDILNYL